MHKGGTGSRLHAYDGYPGDPIWESKENYSTYYDYIIDKQCKVPIRSISEVKAELEAQYANVENSADGS